MPLIPDLLEARLRRCCQHADVVVLSDYAKGVLTESVCHSIIAEAGKLGVPVLVDPKQRDFSRYRGATTICPNLKELSAATGEPVADYRSAAGRGPGSACFAGHGVHGCNAWATRASPSCARTRDCTHLRLSARFTTFPGPATRSSQFWRWPWHAVSKSRLRSEWRTWRRESW